MPRSSIYPPSVRVCVLELLFSRGQLVDCSTGSDWIDGESVRALRLWGRLWRTGFDYRGSALLVTRNVRVQMTRLTAGGKSNILFIGRLSGQETSSNARD